MAKLSMDVIDYLMDEDSEFDVKMEEVTRSSVSSKEVRIKCKKDCGEVIGNNCDMKLHRKY